MSSSSSSSTSSSPKTASQNSRTAGPQADSESGWSTRYKRVRPKTTLPWTLVAYAAGGSLPGTIKKMTRDHPREGTTGLRRRDWFLFGKETRLFWVSPRHVWDKSARSFAGEYQEGVTEAMKDHVPLVRPCRPFFSMPEPHANAAHVQLPTDNVNVPRSRGDPTSAAGMSPATAYRGGFNGLQRASSGGGFGVSR